MLEHVAHADNLDAQIAVLLRSDIIRELRRYPEPEYVFRHGLLRESCLAAPPAARRRELCGRVAAAFATLFAGSLDDYLDVLANYYSRSYYSRSADLDKALGYLERAGEQAASLDAPQQAAALWERALKVAERLEDPGGATARVPARIAQLNLSE